MKNVLKRVGSIIMAIIMIVSTNVAFVFASDAKPPEITECGSYISGDFDIKFGNGYDGYLNAITGVSVGGVDYEKTTLAFDISGASKYYIRDNNILIGEGGTFDEEGKAECTITADGYKDLVLELDKNAHTATVKASSTEPEAHEHTGGTATCEKKAVCSTCGKEYGDYADHNYVNGVCSVCGAKDPSVNKNTPPTLSSCKSNWGWDFKITFENDASDYLSSITGITVADKTYTLKEYSSSVYGNECYYVDSSYLLIGEGGIGDTGKAECVITADGYKDLVLELDKNAHTATVKSSSTEPEAHEHTGGTATCEKKAVCSTCGKEYGDYADHNYVNGVCSVCGAKDPSVNKNTPPTLSSCKSNWGWDFKITFENDASDYLSSITGITVADKTYTLKEYSSSVYGNECYYVDSSYLLIGEGGIGDTGKAECVITADGYKDLVLELDKNAHTATVKSSSTEPEEHEHKGGTATCEKKAICSICGKEYGDFGPHNYVDGFCKVCGEKDPDYGKVTPEFSVDDSESWYVILETTTTGYVKGVTEISVNGTKFSSQSFKMAVKENEYYLENDTDKIYFANTGVLKSGDVIEITNPDYSTVKLKVSIAFGKLTVEPVDGSENPGDNYELHVRLVGSFESALVNQKGYDAISSASTNVTQNKNSNASVEATILPKGQLPVESDWKLLSESGITINSKQSKVNLDSSCGMVGVYSVHDGSVTLAGTPSKAGTYEISVTITDDQGRTATSNSLTFKVYTGNEYLEDQLVLDNCIKTADGKYMYDMEPWKIINFDRNDSTVIVPKDVKAWYGSHTSGTYGELGYAVPFGDATTQTLVIPNGCNLTLVNMDILSSVKIVVENGGKLILRDSTAEGIIEVLDGGTFSMNYNDYGGGEFLNGASINGQLILQDGATIENALIYSNTNNIANGSEARKNTNPVVVVNGNVKLKGNVYIRGDNAPTGTDTTTGKSYSGQTGLLVNGTLTLEDGSILAVFGGGMDATTSVGGTAIKMDNGTITGNGKLIARGADGTFDNGGNAVEGTGTISTNEAYLEGGCAMYPKQDSDGGSAATDTITISDSTNTNRIDGKIVNSETEKPSDTYWRGTSQPDLSLYPVGEKKITHDITLVNGVGYDLTAINGSSLIVDDKGSFSFELKITDGYTKSDDFAVKVNKVAVELTDNKYTITDITEDKKVTVEGIVEVSVPTYKVEFKNGEGYTILSPGNDPTEGIKENGSYTFDVIIADGYEKGENFAVKVNGEIVEPDGAYYVISNIAENKTITVEGVVKTSAEIETVAAPVITPDGGSFRGSKKVSISCDTKDALIYYTTDGSTPNGNSDVYTGEFTITKSCTVKAIEVKEGMNSSDVVSAKFTKKTSSSSGSSSTREITSKLGEIENGTVAISSKTAYSGSTVTATPKADEGYVLSEIKVVDAKGKKVDVTNNGDGTYSYKVPTLTPAVVTAEFEKENTADDTTKTDVIVLTINSVVADVFGKQVVNDVAPVIRNDRTMLPARFVAEALGASVEWNEAAQKVTITKENTVIEITIGSNIAFVNGMEVILDSPAFIENSRTYLPLRFIAENLGAEVEWNQELQQIYITPGK